MASPQMSDRWLWLTLGVAAFVAGKAIQYALLDIVSLTVIEPESVVERLHTEEEEEDEPEDALSLSTLRTLCYHPNSRIATSARSLIVQKFSSDPSALKSLREECSHPDPTRRRRAQLAMRYLEEWSESAAGDFNPDFDDEDDYNEEAPYVLQSDLREMAMEMLRRRPPGAQGEESMNDRLTSLAEELGMQDGGEMDYRRLLGNVRILTAAAAREDEDDDDDGQGHMENARQLGVENFAGIDSSGTDYEDDEDSDTVRTARRETYVMQRGGGELQGDDEEPQRSWWVV